MKYCRYILLIFIYVFIAPIYSQVPLTGPVSFEGLSTIYELEVEDNFRIDQNNTGDYSYLNKYDCLDIGNDLICIYIDAYGTNGFIGLYIERRNVNGQVVWWQYLGKDNGGTAEKIASMKLVEDDLLEVIVFKDLESEELMNNIFFKANQPKAYIIDVRSGDIIDSAYEENFTSSDTIFTFLNLLTVVSKKSGGYVFPYMTPENESFNLDITHYDKEMFFDRKDSFSINRAYSSYNFPKPKSLSDGSFVSTLMSNEVTGATGDIDSLYDLFEARLHFYDSEFIHEKIVEISPHLPYNWRVSDPLVINEEIMIFTQDSSSIDGVIPYTAATFFDNEGNFIRTVDFGALAEISLYPIPIGTTGKYLWNRVYLDTLENVYKWNMIYSDTSGAHTSISTFKSNDERPFILQNMNWSANADTIFVHGLSRVYNEDLFRYENQNNFWLAFESDDLGIGDLLQDNLSSNENLKTDEDIIIYPNPVRDYINIDIQEGSILEIKITDINGRVLKKKSLKPIVNFLSIDVKTFPRGLYYLTFSKEGEKIKSKSFIKY